MKSAGERSSIADKDFGSQPPTVPFTRDQTEIWLAGRSSAVGEADVRGVFPINGRVCPDTLRKALACVLQQLPLLRARLHLNEKEPFFELDAFPDVALELPDLGASPVDLAEAHRWADEFFERPLGEQPIRCALIRLSESESLYIVKVSHLAMDGVGLSFHVELVAEAYRAVMRGAVPDWGKPCAAMALHDEDRKHTASSRFSQDIDWWKSHLAQLPERRIFRALPGCADVLELARHQKYFLSAAGTAKIHALLEARRISASTFFTALHALIVSYMCNEKQVVVQTPTGFGERKNFARRQGSQISLPPLNLDLARHRLFSEVAEEVATQSKHFFRHIRTPYQLAMRQFEHGRFACAGDTFVNVIPHTPAGNEDFPVAAVIQKHSAREAVLFGVMIMEEGSPSRFFLNVRSSCNHLTEQDVARYVKRVELLAGQLAECDELSQLDFLLDEEKRELAAWQRGDARPYAARTIPALFDEIAARHADRPAARDESGGVRTYAELQRRSQLCAAWLTGQGVKKGDVVGVRATRGLRLLETLLGIMRLGAVYLPLDPKSPPERLEHIVADANAVLTLDPEQTDYAAVAAPARGEAPGLRDGAYLIYTSGSTGRPKGVLVPHGGFINMIQGQVEIFGITPEDHVLQFASPAFDASLSEIFMALLAGACLYPVTDRYRTEPWSLKEYMREHAVSVVTFPPSYLHLFEKAAFQGLRVLITAGESPVTDDALHYAGQLEYFNAYGPTETCVCASIKRVAPDEKAPISVGRVIPNATAYILDAEKRPLPAGMTGELHIGGASLSCGYYHNESLTASRFLTLPSGERVYATGDLAQWSAGGEILLAGRTDDQVKIRGNRVEPGEVSFLIEKCAGVQQAFVLAAPGSDGKPMLAAFLILREGVHLNAVVEWSLESLPAYMVPSSWHPLEAMPVTVTGKIDRARLRAMIAQSQAAAPKNASAVNPELLRLAESALGRRYDPAVDFFAQGGDSLQAMAFLHGIATTFHVEIPFRRFAQCGNLQELETLLQPQRARETVADAGTAPLSRNQFQLWAYQQANEGSIDYNMPFLMEVAGERGERFVEALRQAIAAQPLLACTLAGEIDAPHFAKTERAEIPLPVAEFTSEASAAAYFDRLAHTPFDLRREPPVKLAGARIGPRFQLLLLLHHIAGDAETLSLLLRTALLQLQGKECGGGRLVTQAAFCRRETEYLASAEAQADRAYWDKILATPLPYLHASQKRRGAMALLPLDAALSTAIERLAKGCGTTVLPAFAALLGAFLRQKYARSELLIGLPVGLRETPEEFESAGFYVNTVALRLPERADADAPVLVGEAAQQFKEALAHSRHCGDRAAADVLATHSRVAEIDEPGLSVRTVEMRLKASKLSASFTLETGATSRLVLEYDALFIADGDALLAELSRFLADACGAAAPRDPTQVLAEAWREILRVEPGADSEFFRSGGDSIKAIQITGILHRNGIKTLGAADFFRAPTFADLCRLLETDAPAGATAGADYAAPAPGQTLPLLPLQAELIAGHPEHWKSFHMLLPLELGPEVPKAKIEAWLRGLPARFEALRLAFSPAGAVALAEPQRLALKTCAFDAGVTLPTLVRESFKEIAADLDPAVGRTFGAALAEQSGKRFLVLAGHHLVLDALSLGILREDLRRFCETGEAEPEPFGIATRAVEVEKRVQSGAFPTQEDRQFWKTVAATPTGKLQALIAGQRDRAAERVFESRRLEGFSDASQSAAAEILSALARALHASGQRTPIFVALESHGRDALLPAFDTSRSLGWFTSVCPMPLAPAESVEEARVQILPWMRDHFGPASGHAYGYLKRAEPAAFACDAQVGFNYFGSHLAGMAEGFKPLPSVAMPGVVPELIHPDFEPASPLDLVAYFDEAGVLQLGAYFSPKVLPADWVVRLLDGWIEALKTLPAYAPVLPEALRQRLAELSGCELADIESIRSPDACHEPMLYQHLAAADATYTQQIEFYFEGEVDEFALMKAWRALLARHESLRSLFPMPHPGEFYRLVLKEARTSTEYHDLSGLPATFATEKVNALLAAERARGFELGRGPLVRAQFHRLGPKRLMMSWCFHHLLMDGWCIGILLRELFALYQAQPGRRGAAEPLPAPVPLSDYAAWRARFDEGAAKRHWQSLLEGFRPVAPYSGKTVLCAKTEPATHELVVETGLAAKLKDFASANSVTLPILVQSLWAVLLGMETGARRDVAFGVVTSGRPADLPDIGRTVGLFIQTLPVRARWEAGDAFSRLLTDLKAQSLAQMQHGYLPLPAIGRDLFDHLLVFENYPYETTFDGGAVELACVDGFEQIPYPLGISVVQGNGLLFRFLYDPTRLERSHVQGLGAKILALLEAVVGREEVSCRDLESTLIGVAGGQSPALEPRSSDAERSGVISVLEMPVEAPATQAAAPRGIETALLGIYESVLGCPVPSVDADFFRLGGHSLLAMRVIAQVSKAFSVRLTIDDVMRHCSVRKLARFIESVTAPVERLAAGPAKEKFPLSSSQMRLWFLQRLHEDSRVHLIPFAARLSGSVNRDALQEALALLERRHDALRLRVSATEPEQRLVPPGQLRLEYCDRPFSAEEMARVEMPFGFENPLVRVALFREPDGGFVLTFCAHHIVFDGWSAEIFVRELNQAYAAVVERRMPDWAPLDVGYAQYAEWAAKQGTPGLEAVRQMLLPLPERLALPLDFSRPALQSSEGRVHAFRLSEAQSGGLKRYAADLGVTVFPVLLALCNTLLYRHAGQKELIVGCPAANRELEQTQSMMGLFVNTLAVRSTLKTDEGFELLVRDVQGAFQTALSNQSCPFDRLLDSLKVERTPSRNPLFDVFVALEGAEWAQFGRAPLDMQPVELPHDRSKFDLSFYFKETPTGACDVHIEYCTALFRDESIQRIGRRLTCLLDDVLRRAGTPLSALEIIPADEREQLAAFNRTAEAFDIEHDADWCFRAQLVRTPQATAVVEPSGGAYRYAEFDREVSALTGWLLENGVARGDFVGVCYERSLDLMVAIFAVLRAGATYVPLSPSLPAARFQSIFEDLGRCPVLCQAKFAETFEALGQPVLVPEIQRLPAREVRLEPIDPSAVAYSIFTSGSTGRPKGALVEHRSLLNRILWMQSRFPIGAGDVVLQKTTISFDVSVWELLWWSWTGAALAMLEPEAEKEPRKIVEAIHAHRVTVLHFVPSMLRAFLEYLETFPEERSKLASLRYVFASGEALPRDLVLRFQACLSAELHNLYGPTEAAIDVTWYPCTQVPGEVIPIGRPVSNTQIYVLDERLREVPIGVAGEIYIGGVQVARGYVNRKELTAERFLADPFIPGNRMYRTGDLGRWLSDGNVEYLGRNDDQVKVRGFRIELGEIEAALGRCTDVSQAVVRVRKVGGYDSLEAFLLPREGATLSASVIQSELAALLPAYMCPGLLHEVDEIPLSSSGKADRKRLKGRPLAAAAEHAGEKTLTASQEAIAQVWQEVIPELGTPDIDRGFFEAGGNSLLLTRLHTLLEAKWSGVFTIASLFAESTIAAQAALLEKSGAVKRSQASAPAAHDASIAIIGMAVRLGDYEELAPFWADLAAGADKTIPLPLKRRAETRQLLETVGLTYDEARLNKAAYLSDISSFDHKRFGLSPNDASLIEPQQRLFLETALRALDDAGYGGTALQDRKVGVFVGASPVRLFQDALSRAFPDQSEQIYLLNVPSNVVARISYLKNWSGPAATVDTACSSSLTALHEACESLRAGACDAAVVGGANIINLPVKAERSFTIESSTGQTRTFDAKADGVGGGEGAAVFVLKCLDQALKDGDSIHAVIAGSAINQDGKASSMAAPNPAAQAEVIALAAEKASVALGDMDFFEAHGTATVLGDPVEIEGLTRAFAAKAQGEPARATKALIGSIKGNIGHLDAAAGALGVAKAVMSLKRGAVPPQPHFESPNPHINFDAAPVRVAQRLEALPVENRPWLCGVSSFGLSGVNAHVVLREAPTTPLPADEAGWYCVPLSAGDEAGLKAYVAQLREAVSYNEAWPLHAIAGTLTAGREPLEVRVAFVVSTRAELLARLAEEISPVRPAKLLSSSVDVVAFSSREEALRCAEAFLAGQRLHWPEDRPLHRVHLPATPFLRKPLWPRFKSSFLSKPLPTPDGQAFSVAIGKPDFWPVAEHRLNQVPTLVGMASIELIVEAAGTSAVSIEDLSWHRPVTFVEGNQAALFLKKGADAALAVELHHAQQDKWSLAMSAKLRLGQLATPHEIDLTALRDSLRPFDVTGEQTLVRVSERWNCRTALWVSEREDRLLARLVLPDAFKTDLNTYKWHPAMLDLAASLALHKTAGFVPARCPRITPHKPLPAEVYASVTITERKPQLVTADCVVTDKDGQVLIEMSGLVFVSLQNRLSEPETKRSAEPVLYSLRWEKTDFPAAAPAGARKLLLLGRESHALHRELAGIASLRREIPADRDARVNLAREVVDGGVTHVVCLSSPDCPHWAVASLMQELCRARLRAPLHVTVVGSGAFANHDSTPHDALSLGLLHSLRQEEPLLSCAYLELESRNAASLATLKSSLGRFSGAYLIGAEGDVRAQTLAPLGAAARPSPTVNGCVVISGGLGGMGQTLAKEFAEHTQAKVVLLHRRAEGAGDCAFANYRCDINDAARVREVFAQIRKDHGPIKGIVHAAGLAGEGILLTKEQTAYERVLEPKVTGTWNLHEASLGDSLDFFILASSRTALTGAAGQCDYAAANAYLNAFAECRRNKGLPAVAICWNAWAEVGMAARFGTDNAGFALAPKQAWGVIQQALAHDGAQVVVAMEGEDIARFRAVEVSQPAPSASEESKVVAKGPRFSEAQALEIVRDAMGYEEILSRESDFYELGGDSISATQVIARINETFGVDVGVMDLLDCSTLGEFIDRVRDALGETAPSKKPAMLPAPAREKYPVGREQLSILYAELLSGTHTGFNLPLFLKLPADADKARLEAAIAALIDRHEVLRTTFCDFEQERPSMIVHPARAFTLEEVALADLSAKDALIVPFDVKSGELFRAKLLRVGGGERVLFLDIHHALADGRTISLLNADLHALYHGRPLAPVGLQQKDIAWHQFTHTNAEDKAYWSALFQGELPKLDLPSDLKRPATHTNRGATYEFELSAALVDGIEALARREGVTRYTVVLTAWRLLIHRYTRSEDFVIAVTADGREENLGTAGMLAALLPLRMRTTGGKPTGALLREVQQVSNDARRHQSYILNDLLTDIHPPLHLDRTLLSEVILSYMNFEFGDNADALFETLPFHNPASKADLSIFASEYAGRIAFFLEYYADLFTAENVREMARDIVTVLERMVSGDSQAVLEFEPRPRVAMDRVERVLDGQLGRQVESFAAKGGHPVEDVLLATFAALLSRVMSRSELAIRLNGGAVAEFVIDENTEFEQLLASAQSARELAPRAVSSTAAAPARADASAMALGFAYSASGPVALDVLAGGGLVCAAGWRDRTFHAGFHFDRDALLAETAENWLGYFELFLGEVTKGPTP